MKMEEHSPYQNRLKRNPDFIVEYEFDPCDELKSSKPGQGMRVDFLYEGDNPSIEGVHMIWPELLDGVGEVIKDKTPGKIATCGKANMWVVDESRRPYHANRLKIATKGYWVRGSLRLANVTVTEIGSLKC
jgi:hypothetical protein